MAGPDPQGFRYGLLRRALEQAAAGGVGVTDEASAVEALGLSPRLVPGRRDNLKITHPEDLALAAHVLAAQREGRALHAGQGALGMPIMLQRRLTECYGSAMASTSTASAKATIS